MNTSNNNLAQEEASERRGITQDLIRKLIQERQEMLVNFCSVAGLDPYSPEKPTKDSLKDFCEVMVDYLALGHFEVYPRISEGRERRQQVSELADKIYPRIAKASGIAIEFNDKYDTKEDVSWDSLSQDLSNLGETLAARVDLEDQLIHSMLYR
ncbi:MAG: Rsd/AlgQ family anti-sigma factor [Methylococcales bacterium]|jgi:regulator of sigma D|nr:Rsd/AlgQ family anti-sigma factor [Methylococcales bacterium]MBT7445055.1 Rsd/AlgQ family anti-sigma factor [Methylococcales bacterium]